MKLQLMQSGNWFVNVPTVIVKMFKWEKGDEMEWGLDYNKNVLVLRKVNQPAFERLKSIAIIKSHQKYFEDVKDGKIKKDGTNKDTRMV